MPEHVRVARHAHERPLSALDTIFMRRSIRAYTEQSLDESTIRGLLDAAVQAPTAMHCEPWVFVIVQDAAALKRISERAKGGWIKEAAEAELKNGMLHVTVEIAKTAAAKKVDIKAA